MYLNYYFFLILFKVMYYLFIIILILSLVKFELISVLDNHNFKFSFLILFAIINFLFLKSIFKLDYHHLLIINFIKLFHFLIIFQIIDYFFILIILFN